MNSTAIALFILVLVAAGSWAMTTFCGGPYRCDEQRPVDTKIVLGG